MTKRVTPATTAIGVITVTLLVAGGTRLISPDRVAAGAGDTPGFSATLAATTLPPDGTSATTLTVAGPAACGGIVLGIGAGSVNLTSDGGLGFAAIPTNGQPPSGYTKTMTVTLGSGGNAQVAVETTKTSGLENIIASFTGNNCTGTASAQLFEVGAPAAISVDAPSPARLKVSAGTTTTTATATSSTITAHVVDANQTGIPGQTVILVRSGDGSQTPMTDAGGGAYTATLQSASGPRSDTLIAVDTTASPALQSAPQTLTSVASDADCGHLGLRFNPTTLVADGKSTSAATAAFFNNQTPAANEPVSFTADPGLNVTSASPTTDGSGGALATVHAGYTIGTKKVTVTDPNSLISCSATVAIGNGTPGTKDSGQLSRFIYRAYQDVLHRTGEDAGVEYFGNFVNFGGSRGQVALTFTTTTEYLTNVVNGLYQSILGRGGDPDGVTYWVGQLANGGTTDEQLAALFLSSDEFYATHGGTDGGFIDGLYQAVLGRPADADGRNSWLAALGNGWSRVQVAYAFTGSSEQLSQKVIGYYSTFLHRSPTSAGDVSYWVNAMQNGVHDENVMAAFIGSQEYFDQS